MGGYSLQRGHSLGSSRNQEERVTTPMSALEATGVVDTKYSISSIFWREKNFRYSGAVSVFSVLFDTGHVTI